MKKLAPDAGKLLSTLPRPLRSKSKLTRSGWVIPKAVEEDLDAPVDYLDLSTKAANILTRLHVNSVRQLLNYPKEKLIRVRGFGRKCRAEIEIKVFEYLLGRRQAELGLLAGIRKGVPALPLGTKTFVHRTLSFLREQERSIVADRYGLWDGEAMTLQEIGGKLGLTRERIRQIEARSLDRLRRIFGSPVVKEFLRIKIRSAVARKSKNNCGVLSENELIAAMADDCTIDEAVLAIAFLQDVDLPGGNLFSRYLIKVEEGVYCLDSPRGAECGKVL